MDKKEEDYITGRCWSCAKWDGCKSRFYMTGGNCGVWKPNRKYRKKGMK